MRHSRQQVCAVRCRESIISEDRGLDQKPSNIVDAYGSGGRKTRSVRRRGARPRACGAGRADRGRAEIVSKGGVVLADLLWIEADDCPKPASRYWYNERRCIWGQGPHEGSALILGIHQKDVHGNCVRVLHYKCACRVDRSGEW